MKACYLPDGAGRDRALQTLKNALPAFDPNQSARFSFSAKVMSLAALDSDVSALAPVESSSFDEIAVAPGLRLFPNNWGKAFLAHVQRLLSQSGELHVPYTPGKSEDDWTLTELQEFFQQQGKVDQENHYVSFSAAPTSPKVPSVLSWYYDHYARTTLNKVEVEPTEQLPSTLLTELSSFLLPGNEKWFAPDATASSEESISVPAFLESTSDSFDYLLHGPSYKNAILSHILRQNFDSSQPLAILDHGGGPGFLCVDLLLEHEQIQRAVNCDINPGNLWLLRRLCQYYQQELQGRFFIDINPAQDHHFDQKYDMVSYVGSLLYVPREHTQTVLDRAWEALNPGGILVIHENVRHPSFERDYQKMFTTDEIDEYLQRYGAIRYYLSTRAREVTREQAGVKTVFRVVRKG